MPDKIAVIMTMEQVNAIAQYLATKPFAEVNQFFDMLGKLPGLEQAQLDTLFPQPQVESPE
jgi:hypothetical protein